MALTDLLKSFVRGVTLSAALYSCGDTKNYYGNGGNGNSQEGCRDICEYIESCGGLSRDFSVSQCTQDCDNYNLSENQMWTDCIYEHCTPGALDVCEQYLDLPEDYDQK